MAGGALDGGEEEYLMNEIGSDKVGLQRGIAAK